MTTLPMQALSQMVPASLLQSFDYSGLFPTEVTLRYPRGRECLDESGMVVISDREGRARVLATEEQIETLAHLGCSPHSAEEPGRLISANSIAKPWPVIAPTQSAQASTSSAS